MLACEQCLPQPYVSFASEIADVIEKSLRADIDDIRKVVESDRRISLSFFGSGAGHEDSRFPKDVTGIRMIFHCMCLGD